MHIEQYIRRLCIRIRGVQYNENDDVNAMSNVERCCDEIGIKFNPSEIAQPAITCSKLIIETLDQGVKYIQS